MAKPNSTKKPVSVPNHSEEIFDSSFAVPPEIKAEIKEKGLACRWVNGTSLQKSFGFNKNRWVPFKSEKAKAVTSMFGGDPEGYVRRGDLILAVKPKELQDKHRAYLADKLAGSKGVLKKKTSEDMRQIAEEHGVKAKFDNSYDENDDE